MMHSKQIIINKTLSEIRIVLLEKGKVSEIFLERAYQKKMIGTIYKGIVNRVLPGMNSAFVDIGMKKAAFLFGKDIVDEKAYIYPVINGDSLVIKGHVAIENHIKEGQHIIVQISKEPIGSKGARATMHIAIPGRLLVFIPYCDHIGISRKIEANDEREKFKNLITSIKSKKSGAIVRTAAKCASDAEIINEYKQLQKHWSFLEQNLIAAPAPSEIYRDINITEKTIRDIYSEEVDEIIIDDKEIYENLALFLRDDIPSALPKLRYYQEQHPIFDTYGVEIDIGAALNAKVDLKSGGYLIIEQTEALTTFDVNTGRYVGKSTADQTILQTNLEACTKIVEELKIRNIGGIIVIDFIDMDLQNHRELIYTTLLQELKKDRAPTSVLPISELGLVQMTRKRTSDSIERQMLSACPRCDGKGYVKSTITEAYDLIREIIRYSLHSKNQKLRVIVSSDILEWLFKNEKNFLDQLQLRFKIEIIFETASLNHKRLREASYEVIELP